MANLQSDSEFFGRVSNEARVREEDARLLVEDFLRSISEYIGKEAAQVLQDIAPAGLSVEKSEQNIRDEESTIKEFLLAMSDEESAPTEQAAKHARAVAQALRERADATSLRRLRELVENEEILALFELDRGELTEVEPPKAGERPQSDD